VGVLMGSNKYSWGYIYLDPIQYRTSS